MGEPPSFTVEVNPPGLVAALPVARLRFVDGYWADAFVAPSPRQVVRWLALVGPNLAVAQAVLGPAIALVAVLLVVLTAVPIPGLALAARRGCTSSPTRRAVRPAR